MPQVLKSWSFWVSMSVTVLGLFASNGGLGTGQGMVAAGWVATIASMLGVHLLLPAAPAAPIVPPTAS